MVPAAFVFLEKFPLTNNGKVDRKALPVPEQQRPELAGRYVAPRTPAEETLSAIWKKTLRVERVGVNDNFFELGGDSILSIQIISSARREGLQLTPALLFAHQTIAELSAAAGGLKTTTQTLATPGVVAGEVALTPIEKWFFEQQLEDVQHYNQSFLFEVSERMERKVLENALAEVQRHHDALRLRFEKTADGWRQSYSATESMVPLAWTDLSQADAAKRTQALEKLAASEQASLNLKDGPLWRAAYFDFGEAQPGRLLLAIHHLAVDGISWRPLLEDLESAYRQIKTGKKVELPAKTSSYKEWAERINKHAESQALRLELPYWKAATDPQNVSAALKPLEINAPAEQNTEGAAKTLKVSLTPEETRALLQVVPAAYNTQINDVLLTALLLAWNKWSGSRVLFTNLEGHGREHLFEDLDLSRTAGWFTSIFPVRLELPDGGEKDQPGEILKSVKEQLRKIPQRGIGFGMLRYLASGNELAGAAEPALVFNYLGQFDQILGRSGLFRFAEESTGPWHSPKQKRRQILETNCVVINGRLEIAWTYNQNLHAGKDVGALAAEYTAALKDVIAHCQSDLAGGRTPSDFPLARLEQSAIDSLFEQSRDMEDVYPLSPIQTLFYSANPGKALLSFDQWHCSLGGELQLEAFQRAWHETVRRHSILRSTIHGEDLREPVQVVHRDIQLTWTIEDWRASSVEECKKRWIEFLRQDRGKPLMLNEAPVMRFALIRWRDRTWKFLWSVPALLLDGWSWPLVFRDASRLYEAYSKNVAPQLEVARPYRDYVEWLNGQANEEATKFWQEQLAGFRRPTPLPGDLPARDAAGERYLQHVVQLSSEATNALQSAARRTQVTLNTLVQGSWSLLLSRQSGNPDVIFGAAFSGRPADLPGVESIVGPFTNNLPVRVTVNTEAPGGEFFRTVHNHLLKLASYQFTPLMEIQRSSEVPWRYRLFDSLVVFQNYLVDETARRLGEQVEIADFEGPIHTNYPVLLLAEPDAGLRLTLVYDRKTVARSTMERWGHDLQRLLELGPALLDKSVGELQKLLSPRAAQVGQADQAQAAPSQNFMPAQTEMEKSIAAVWQKMFGLEQINVETNFFELGGHSLLLVQMHGLLRQALSSEFPIVALFEHPTVRALARHLGQPAESSNEKSELLRDRALRQKRALAQMRVPVKK
jgi:non-ribosomal peptide synthase protein (TIGR01720 family)